MERRIQKLCLAGIGIPKRHVTSRDIQGVRKIANISGRDLKPQKKEKKLIYIGPEISRFRVIATFMLKKMYFIFRVASLFKFFN